MIACERTRGDVGLARWLWRRDQKRIEAERPVFVDETGTATNMAPRYGWGLSSDRVIGRAPCKRWQSTTFVAGLTERGFIASLVTDGAMNAAVFEARVEQALVPTLPERAVVVMDNLSCRWPRGAAARGSRRALPVRRLQALPAVQGRENLCTAGEAVGYEIDGAFAEFVRVPARAVAAGNLRHLPERPSRAERRGRVRPVAPRLRSRRRPDRRRTAAARDDDHPPLRAGRRRLSRSAWPRAARR